MMSRIMIHNRGEERTATCLRSADETSTRTRRSRGGRTHSDNVAELDGTDDTATTTTSRLLSADGRTGVSTLHRTNYSIKRTQ